MDAGGVSKRLAVSVVPSPLVAGCPGDEVRGDRGTTLGHRNHSRKRDYNKAGARVRRTRGRGEGEGEMRRLESCCVQTRAAGNLE